MKKRASIPILSFLLTLSLLTGCGSSAKSTSYMVAETVAETAAAAAPMASATFDTGEYDVNEIAMEEAGSGVTSSSELTQNTVSGRKLIRTVSLDVETYDFDTLLTSLNEQITALNGYVEQSNISGNSVQDTRSRRWAYMTVRIPSTKLDRFIQFVESDGNVTNKSETTTDVTLQYSDLESKKKSLSIEQDRIWELLEKADTLEAVIALEERLSEIRYELESMESQLKLYDNQVEYSTVHVNIQEVKVYTSTEPETIGERIQKGFTANLENMQEFLVDLFVFLVSSSPILIPILIVVLIIITLFRRKHAAKSVKKIASTLPVDLNLDSSDKDETSK